MKKKKKLLGFNDIGHTLRVIAVPLLIINLSIVAIKTFAGLMSIVSIVTDVSTSLIISYLLYAAGQVVTDISDIKNSLGETDERR